MTVQKCISTIINPVADHTGSPSHPFLMAEWERLAFQHFQKVTQSRVWQKKGGNEFQSTYQYFHPTRPSSFQTTSILTVTCETVSNLLSNSINKNAVFLDQTLTLIIPRCRNPWSTSIHVYRLNSAREIAAITSLSSRGHQEPTASTLTCGATLGKSLPLQETGFQEWVCRELQYGHSFILFSATFFLLDQGFTGGPQTHQL